LFKPPSEFGPADAEYDAKLDALAGAITRMDPYVLAVQEVGDPVALQEFADRVCGTWHIETADPETGIPHAIRVGILSRVALNQPQQVSAFPDKLRAIQQGDGEDDDIKTMGRPALHARVLLDGVDVEIISAHFKSRLLTFPGGRFSPHDEPGSVFRRISHSLPARPERRRGGGVRTFGNGRA
jgi:hypothetical protein